MQWSLSELLAPVTVADFLGSIWGQRAFVGKIPEGAMAWLLGELEGGDVAKLVRRFRGQIAVWFRTLEGEFRVSAAASADDALAFFNGGLTLFLHNGAATPAVAKWQRQLADQLGHPTIPLTASLFCGRRTSGNAAHFDHLENITIQLRGSKRWRIAPNPSVRQPLENWTIGQKVSPSLAGMLERALPAGMPDGAESIELTAGSMLYLPRGHFHETDASADSVQLFLGFPVASWADLLLEGMRAKLERLPHWRENALGGSSPEQVQRAQRRLDELRAGLPADLEGLDTAFLLPEVAAPFDVARQVRRNPLAVVQVDEAPQLLVHVTLPLGKLGRKHSLPVAPRLAPLVHWLIARPAFTIGEMLEAHPAVERATVLELLAALQFAGLIT